MDPQNVSLLVQALAAGVLACIPVYQKWRSAKREEAVADRNVGILQDLAVRETVKSWEFVVCAILALVVLVSLLNSFAFAQKGLKITQTLRDQITEYRATAQADRTRIETKLDLIIAKLNSPK